MALTPNATGASPPEPLCERLLRVDDAGQQPLPLATPGVQRTVWEGRFGVMLIEVAQGVVYVNGQAVEPAPAGAAAEAPPPRSAG